MENLLQPEKAPALVIECFRAEDPKTGGVALLARGSLSLPDDFRSSSKAEEAIVRMGASSFFRENGFSFAESSDSNLDDLLTQIPGGFAKGQFVAAIDATICLFWARTADEHLVAAKAGLTELPIEAGALAQAISPTLGTDFPDSVPFGARLFFEGSPAASLEAIASAVAKDIQILPIGSFRCDGGALAAIDPCYYSINDGVSISGASGEYRAWSVVRGMDDWGSRRAELWICAEGVSPETQFPGEPGWRLESESVGVDSGQAGFFSADAYERLDDDSRDPFYDACCAATLSLGAAALSLGAVSSSGDGDGGYQCLSLRDDSGRLLAARIEFYDRDPDFETALLSEKAAIERGRLAQGTPDPLPAARRPKPL